MFEKVNPAHPDKLADRIAGALVDEAYRRQENPKIAVEVLIGHGICHIIAESSVKIPEEEAKKIVERICPGTKTDFVLVPQDTHLAQNQAHGVRCGDNGIFCGAPITEEQQRLTDEAAKLYEKYKADGKYILDGKKLTICQSKAKTEEIISEYPEATVNPIGEWTGGTDVDTGATNRKLGSDMGDGVTGGGIHGKDASKADVSVNIWAHMKAQETGRKQQYSCAIGDTEVGGIPYKEIVKEATAYIQSLGGFEKLAEWGMIRPKEVRHGKDRTTKSTD